MMKNLKKRENNIIIGGDMSSRELAKNQNMIMTLPIKGRVQ